MHHASLFALLVASACSATAAPILELHDANGPTGLRVIHLEAGSAQVISDQGYSGAVHARGDLGFANIPYQRYYLDVECTDGPWVTWVPMSGVMLTGNWYTPVTGVETVTLAADAIVYEAFGCVANGYVGGDTLHRLLPNDPAVTGFANSYAPPLRTVVVEGSGGTQCVFANGFECPAE